MNQEYQDPRYPITPPPELVAKWAGSMCGYFEAARWGYQQCADEIATETERRWLDGETEKLIEGRWYWVRLRNVHPDPLDDFYQDPCDGWDVAKHDTKAAGGWTNDDTWEDFDKQVFYWRLISLPNPVKSNS